ncbi:MAG: Ig-like domain-containing protein, partial [Holophagaceae bacterium]|nr:Ig-like domain-containing protein [Holophagaceae bacterium]
MKKHLFYLLTALTVLTATYMACGSNGNSDNAPPSDGDTDSGQVVALKNIRFEPPTVTLEVGQKRDMAIIVDPANATNSFRWQVVEPNSGHLRVSPYQNTRSAIVEALAGASGSYTIRVTANGAPGIAPAECVVTVPVLTTSLTLSSPASQPIAVGVPITISATVLPASANPTLSWNIPSDIFNVTNSTNTTRTITAKAPTGENGAIIRATAMDGSGKSGQFTVRVQGPDTPVADIKIKQYSLIGVGSMERLIATILPENATNKNLIWESTSPAIASVDKFDGIVTGVASGSAAIWARTEKAPTVLSNFGFVTVEPKATFDAPTDITLSITENNILLGRTEPPPAVIFTPENPRNKTVTWSSSDKAIATVNKDTGFVTAVGVGSAYITAISESNERTASYQVFVTNIQEPLTGVSITNLGNPVEIGLGSRATLSLAFTPANANNKAVVWSSSDSTTVAVDQGGVVRGLKVGTATITAKHSETLFASRDVKVITPWPDVTKVEILPNRARLEVGGIRQLTASLEFPSGTPDSNKEVTWKSSNPAVADVVVPPGISGYAIVEAKSVGSATITATPVVGIAAPAKCEIQVASRIVDVESITLPGQITIDLDTEIKKAITPTAIIPNDYNGIIEWEIIFGEEFATIDQDGVVTGKAKTGANWQTDWVRVRAFSVQKDGVTKKESGICYVNVTGGAVATYAIAFATGSGTANDVTATGAVTSSNPEEAGETVTVTVALSGTATEAGTHTIGLTSAKAGTITPATQTKAVTLSQALVPAADTFTFTFTMPALDVDDLVVTNGFVAAGSATITPTLATFDKYTSHANYADIAVTLTPGDYTFVDLKNGITSLVSGTDYTVATN